MSDPLELRPVLTPAGRPYATHQVFSRAFTAQQCERIAALASDLDVAVGDVLGEDGDRTDDRFRRSRLSWLPFEDGTAWIYERLAVIAQRANQSWDFELTGFTEDLQVTRYDEPGAFYTWHQDGLDGEVAGRKLSMVLQLSDPRSYQGADLELLEVPEDYGTDEAAQWRRSARARGTVVAFPAFEYHRVTPLRSGTRLSLVCWVGGPPFR